MTARGGYVWVNDGLVPAEQATVSALDRGLLYGDGLFETMRAYGGRVFRLQEHLARLQQGARALRFPRALDGAALERAVAATIAANGLSEAYVRLTVTRGIGGLPTELEAAGEPTVIIMAREYVPRPELYEQGVSAQIAASTRARGTPVTQVKSLNYLQCLLESADARERGHYEAIFCDEGGLVLEGATTNVCAVRQGEVWAPQEGGPYLEGIAVGCVRELTERLGVGFRRQNFSATLLLEAEEAFLTNSLIEVMPLVRLALGPDEPAQAIGTGAPGEPTRRLMGAYRELVQRECRG
jgi:branched-chain amino acid aminotransferase